MATGQGYMYVNHRSHGTATNKSWAKPNSSTRLKVLWLGTPCNFLQNKSLSRGEETPFWPHSLQEKSLFVVSAINRHLTHEIANIMIHPSEKPKSKPSPMSTKTVVTHYPQVEVKVIYYNLFKISLQYLISWETPFAAPETVNKFPNKAGANKRGSTLVESMTSGPKKNKKHDLTFPSFSGCYSIEPIYIYIVGRMSWCHFEPCPDPTRGVQEVLPPICRQLPQGVWCWLIHEV